MIGVAVLGAGVGAEHVKAYAALPDQFDLRMLVDRDAARAEDLGAQFGIFTATEIDSALNDPEIDVIDICLPPHLHAPVTLSALAAGKHVICEKPLATSLKQAHEIAAAAEQGGLSVFPVFQYRWGPELAKLRWLIAQGLAGQPVAAALETHWARDATYYANGWRGTWAAEQGGAILCHAIHAHDLLTNFFGPVAEVSARVTTRVNAIETEDTAAITFRMTNGALASSSVCLGATRDETRLRLIFEHLTATSDTTPYAPGSGTWRFEARTPEHQVQVDDALAKAPAQSLGFEGFLRDVALTLNGKAPQAVTLEDGIASIELVTAIYAAARSAVPQTLPIETTHPLFGGWQP